MRVVKCFSNLSSYSFCLIFTKHGTHDLYAKKCGTDFQNIDLKIFGNFLKF